MTSPRIIRRTAKLADFDDLSPVDDTFRSVLYPQSKEQAVTFWLDNYPLAVFGVSQRWPGVGELWGTVSTRAAAHPIRLVWSVRDMLNAYAEETQMRRLAAWVGIHQMKCRRFAELFGFHVEHVDYEAAPDGSHLLLYVRRWNRGPETP